MKTCVSVAVVFEGYECHVGEMYFMKADISSVRSESPWNGENVRECVMYKYRFCAKHILKDGSLSVSLVERYHIWQNNTARSPGFDSQRRHHFFLSVPPGLRLEAARRRMCM